MFRLAPHGSAFMPRRRTANVERRAYSAAHSLARSPDREDVTRSLADDDDDDESAVSDF